MASWLTRWARRPVPCSSPGSIAAASSSACSATRLITGMSDFHLTGRGLQWSSSTLRAGVQTSGSTKWLATGGHALRLSRRTRFTFDRAEEVGGAWSPDGNRIAFSSNRQGHFDLYQKDSTGAGSEELLLASDLDKYPTSFSTDGRFLLYSANSLKTGADLWVLPLFGDRKPFSFLQTESQEGTGMFF